MDFLKFSAYTDKYKICNMLENLRICVFMYILKIETAEINS